MERVTSSTTSGESLSFSCSHTARIIDDANASWFRIEGALGPWMEKLSSLLLKIYPPLLGEENESLDSLPPSRVTVDDAPQAALGPRKDPLVADREYHTGKLACTRRITAEGWNQDVRHFEFELCEDVQ